MVAVHAVEDAVSLHGVYSVAVLGASGFAGAELLRLCASHTAFDVAVATGDSMADRAISDIYPSLAAAYPDAVFTAYESGTVSECDLVFCALPHGASQAVIPELRDAVGCIVDLAADFRLSDESLYPHWYGEAHTAPELLPEFVFGLPELFRQHIRGAELIAAPGCYVTAASLALAPLVAIGLVDSDGIIVDAASGASGAGRSMKPHTAFCAVDEDFTAYGLLRHRHTPEMEMAIASYAHIGADSVQVLFTPHLAPMNRGILATCYARAASRASTTVVMEALSEAYAGEPFVVVSERLPTTKATLGSNSVHITARVDERTGWTVVISAIDNLMKGASGQAVQCANLALGIEETAGLGSAGVYP